MKKHWKYWIAAIALLIWLVLAWFVGTWLHLQGTDLWVLRIGLGLLGIIAFVILIWWFRSSSRKGAGAAPPGTPEETLLLIREAESHLQSSQLGRGTKIRSLPLYFFLGASGSAKTSTVLHSGLEPELLSGHVLQDNLPVPTRAVNVWFAGRSALVEVGAALLSDPATWTRLVKRLAPAKLHSVLGKGQLAPRAAVVCFDAESLVNPDADQANAALVETTRTRLREACEQLGIRLPVYVLFTRMDRLRFFAEFVRNLSNEEAFEVLGTTLPVMPGYAAGVYADQQTARLTRAFDNLFTSLAEKRLNLLPRERDAASLASVYEFPREFRKLRTTLTQLLVDLCRPSQLRTGPFLRGFYFSGVRPIVVRLTGPSVAEELPQPQPSAEAGNVGATAVFDIRRLGRVSAPRPAPMAGAEGRKVPQWLFLKRLFSDVFLKDHLALRTSVASTKTSFWRRVLLGTAAALLVIFLIGSTVSYVKNRHLEARVVSAAQGISPVTLTGQQLPSLDSLRQLDTLRESVGTLTEYRNDGAPWSMRWGLYVGNTLYPDVRKVYFDHFNQLLFAQTQAALRQTLLGLPATPGPNDQYGPAYDSLKAYLVTTANHDKSTRLFLSPVLLKTWEAGRSVSPDLEQLAQNQFDFYSEQLKAENPFSSEYDTLAVARARGYLSQFSGSERIYRFMLAEAGKANPSINFNRQFPGSAEVVVDGKEVDGAFTKGGWAYMQDAFKNLPKYFSGEQWVLGEESAANLDQAKLAQELQSRYLADFIAQWRAFLRSAAVVRYHGLSDGSQKLTKLSGNQSPLLALFCTAALNTSVGQEDITKAFQPVQSVVSPKCETQYIDSANAPYVNALGGLQACLERAANTPGGQQDAAKAQCLTDATNAQQAVRQVAQKFQIDRDGHIDQVVQNLMLEPIQGVLPVLRPGPVTAAGLCTQFGGILPDYPFNPKATQEASPQALAAIFQPGTGALSKFYDENLTNLLVPQGNEYVPNPAATQKVNPAFLSFFNRAAAIQHALYPGNSPQMRFVYSLRPHPTEGVQSLTLEIDGQTLNYKGSGAAFTQFAWPGSGAPGVKLMVKIAGGSELGFPGYTGPWAVFHFFADADRWQAAGSGFTLDWVLRVAGGRPVTTPAGKPVMVQFDLDTHGAAPILEKGFFADLKCVSDAAK